MDISQVVPLPGLRNILIMARELADFPVHSAESLESASDWLFVSEDFLNQKDALVKPLLNINLSKHLWLFVSEDFLDQKDALVMPLLNINPSKHLLRNEIVYYNCHYI